MEPREYSSSLTADEEKIVDDLFEYGENAYLKNFFSDTHVDGEIRLAEKRPELLYYSLDDSGLYMSTLFQEKPLVYDVDVTDYNFAKVSGVIKIIPDAGEDVGGDPMRETWETIQSILEPKGVIGNGSCQRLIEMDQSNEDALFAFKNQRDIFLQGQLNYDKLKMVPEFLKTNAFQNCFMMFHLKRLDSDEQRSDEKPFQHVVKMGNFDSRSIRQYAPLRIFVVSIRARTDESITLRFEMFTGPGVALVRSANPLQSLMPYTRKKNDQRRSTINFRDAATELKNLLGTNLQDGQSIDGDVFFYSK